MGEGAALLVLEAADVAARRGARPYATVLGYGASSDAHHMVQPRARRRRCGTGGQPGPRDGGVGPDEIDYVNAHASSTPIGDVAEARAIAGALGERAATVPVSGRRRCTAIRSVPRARSRPPSAPWRSGTAGRRRRSTSTTVDPVVGALLPGLLRQGRAGTYRRVLSTSFGFGGLNAALVLGTPDDEEAYHR